MIKNMKYLFALSFLVTLISFNANAQVKKGDLVDGISAVVGDEIVLESDILEQQNYAIQQGAAQTNKCEFMEQILSNKLLIYKAKKILLFKTERLQLEHKLVINTIRFYLSFRQKERC